MTDCSTLCDSLAVFIGAIINTKTHKVKLFSINILTPILGKGIDTRIERHTNKKAMGEKETYSNIERRADKIIINNYSPNEISIYITNGALNNTIKLTDGNGNTIDGQENIELAPREAVTLHGKGAREYILESYNPVMVGVVEGIENHTKTKTMSKQEIEAKIEAFAKTSGVSKTDLKKICLERGLEVLLEKGIQIKKQNNQPEEATA